MSEKTKNILGYTAIAIMAVIACVLLYLTVKPFYYGFMAQAVDYYPYWTVIAVIFGVLGLAILVALCVIAHRLRRVKRVIAPYATKAPMPTNMTEHQADKYKRKRGLS